MYVLVCPYLTATDQIQNNKQTISFHHLWDWTVKLSNLATRRNIGTDMTAFVAPLLNISTEGELQQEIKDVIDELDIMIYINTQQREVMKKFVKEVGHLLNPNPTEQGNLSPMQTSPTHPTSPAWPPGRPGETDHKKRLDDYRWFKRNSGELVDDVEDRIAELEGLKRSAESTSTSVSLLSTGNVDMRMCPGLALAYP